MDGMIMDLKGVYRVHLCDIHGTGFVNQGSDEFLELRDMFIACDPRVQFGYYVGEQMLTKLKSLSGWELDSFANDDDEYEFDEDSDMEYIRFASSKIEMDNSINIFITPTSNTINQGAVQLPSTSVEVNRSSTTTSSTTNMNNSNNNINNITNIDSDTSDVGNLTNSKTADGHSTINHDEEVSNEVEIIEVDGNNSNNNNSSNSNSNSNNNNNVNRNTSDIGNLGSNKTADGHMSNSISSSSSSLCRNNGRLSWSPPNQQVLNNRVSPSSSKASYSSHHLHPKHKDTSSVYHSTSSISLSTKSSKSHASIFHINNNIKHQKPVVPANHVFSYTDPKYHHISTVEVRQRSLQHSGISSSKKKRLKNKFNKQVEMPFNYLKIKTSLDFPIQQNRLVTNVPKPTK